MDTLDDDLPRRPRRRLITPAGVIAGAITVAALGFVGGVEAQKARGGEKGAPARFGAAAGGPREGDMTVGTVASVDGAALYVDGPDGTTLKVKLAKGGAVTRTASAAAKAIHPGDTVVVQGETAANGTLVASSIRATAAGR